MVMGEEAASQSAKLRERGCGFGGVIRVEGDGADAWERGFTEGSAAGGAVGGSDVLEDCGEWFGVLRPCVASS